PARLATVAFIIFVVLTVVSEVEGMLPMVPRKLIGPFVRQHRRGYGIGLSAAKTSASCDRDHGQHVIRSKGWSHSNGRSRQGKFLPAAGSNVVTRGPGLIH